MSESLKGIIINYHIGIRTQTSREYLIDFSHTRSASNAGKLIGRKLVWKLGKNTIIGKVTSFHGRNGIVLARFRKGLPGQALGTTVEVL